jgi:hypothetical protein
MLTLLFLPMAAAWGYQTHVWICEQLYTGNEAMRMMIKNKTLFLEGCNAPDIAINDQRYHNCYYAVECKEIDTSKRAPATLHYFDDISSCFNQSYFSCPALDRFNQTIKARDEYSIGMAIHYYTDAYVPLHQVTGEDYFSCHKPFEDKVDAKVNSKFWTVSQKCTFSFPCIKTGSSIRKCKREYTDIVSFSYEDLVKVVIKTDEEVSTKLNISKGEYGYLLRKTGHFHLIIQKILDFIRKLA